MADGGGGGVRLEQWLHKGMQALLLTRQRRAERLLADCTRLEQLLQVGEDFLLEHYPVLKDSLRETRRVKDCVRRGDAPLLLGGNDLQVQIYMVKSPSLADGDGDGGVGSPAREGGLVEWPPIYDRMQALVLGKEREVEGLLAERTRLEELLKLKEDFWLQRYPVLKDCLREMRSGGKDQIYMEHQYGVLEDLPAENNELKVEKLQQQVEELQQKLEKLQQQGKRPTKPVLVDNSSSGCDDNDGLENLDHSRYKGRTITNTYYRRKRPTKPVLVDNSSRGSDDKSGKDGDHEPPRVGDTAVGDSPQSAKIEIGQKTAFLLGNGGSSSDRHVDDDDFAPMGNEGILRRSTRERRTPQSCPCALTCKPQVGTSKPKACRQLRLVE